MDWVQQQLFGEYYPRHLVNSRFTGITLSMVCNVKEPWKTFPKLKGKAVEMCGLMPALEWLWGCVCNPEDPMHVQIKTLLQCSVKIDEILDNHGGDDCWEPDVSNQFKHVVFGYNALMTPLLRGYGARGGGRSMFLFNVVIKNHYLAHIALISAYINPRLGWTFMGEDLMQKVRRIGGACSRGNSLVPVGRKFTKHYLAGMAFVLSRVR